METARINAEIMYKFKLLEWGVIILSLAIVLTCLCVYLGFKKSISKMALALSCHWIIVGIIAWREGRNKSPVTEVI